MLAVGSAGMFGLGINSVRSNPDATSIRWHIPGTDVLARVYQGMKMLWMLWHRSGTAGYR